MSGASSNILKNAFVDRLRVNDLNINGQDINDELNGINTRLSDLEDPKFVNKKPELSSIHQQVIDTIENDYSWAGDQVTMDANRIVSMPSESGGFTGLLGVMGTSETSVQSFKHIGQLLAYDSAQESNNQNLNLVTPTADSRLDVMSLTKSITGCSFLKMSQQFQNTNWEFVLNTPIQDVIPSLANTTYYLIQKTLYPTDKLNLPDNLPLNLTGDELIIVRNLVPLKKTVPDDVAKNTLMSLATLLVLKPTAVKNVDYTFEVGYEKTVQTITIGDCLAECAGQELLHIAPWIFSASDGKYVSKQGLPYNYTEMVQILNASGFKLPATPPPLLLVTGSTDYPDAHGLAYLKNDSTTAPTQSILLTAPPKAPSYGRATNVVSFYMIQQQYAMRSKADPSSINVFDSPFDIEDILVHYFCNPLNIDSRMTLRRLVNPETIPVDGSVNRATAPSEYEISAAKPVTYLDDMVIPMFNLFKPSSTPGLIESLPPPTSWDVWAQNYFSILGKRIPASEPGADPVLNYWVASPNYTGGFQSGFLYASGVGMVMSSNDIAKWGRMILNRGVTDEGTQFMNFSLWNRWMFGRTVPSVGSIDSQRINRYFGAAVGLPEAPERFLHGMYTDDNNLINYSMPAVPVNTFGQAGSFATRFVVYLDQDLFHMDHMSIFQKNKAGYQDEVKRLTTICNRTADVTSAKMIEFMNL